MIAASAAFTVMISCVKVAGTWGFPSAELMVWRALPAVPALFLLSGLDWRVQRPGLLLVRCVFGFCAMFCFFSSTSGLGIGELSVLTKLQPLFVAVIAPLALGSAEKPGRTVWVALALGMAGTTALVWPFLGEAPLKMAGAAFGLGAAVFSALAHTSLRALGATERPAAVVFWFQLAVGAGAITAVALGSEAVHPPSATQVPVLLTIALCALLGQLWMTRAYQVDRAARVAAASYVSPLMGFVVDALFFGTVPSGWAALGALLVFAAGGVLLGARP
ncbi:MAG: DMT family transporter [Myxococcota bacterium]